MRLYALLLLVTLYTTGCNGDRVFEEYVDFEERRWMVSEKPTFEFEIAHPEIAYDIYCNVRNSTVFPDSRIFIQVTLSDTTGAKIREQLVGEFLFHPKTGEPFGKSGLGDLFDHRFAVFKGHRFERPGKYRILLEQFNRKDTLTGVLAVGVGVARSGGN